MQNTGYCSKLFEEQVRKQRKVFLFNEMQISGRVF